MLTVDYGSGPVLLFVFRPVVEDNGWTMDGTRRKFLISQFGAVAAVFWSDTASSPTRLDFVDLLSSSLGGLRQGPRRKVDVASLVRVNVMYVGLALVCAGHDETTRVPSVEYS